MVYIPFATNSYKLDSLPVSAQECSNGFAEREPQDAKTPISVLGAPGLTMFVDTMGGGPVRGMAMLSGVLCVVADTSLYTVSSTGVATRVGGGIAGSDPVSMAANNATPSQLCIVNGVNGFIWDGTTYSVIGDTDFFASKTVTFFDDYFVFDRDGTSFLFLSALNDGLSYNALDTASAEVQPQNIQCTVNQQESLVVFATGHIETWYDSGAVNFPFQRIDGATIERGLVAPHAVVKEDNSVFFLGDDLVFYRLDGVIPRRVSTHSLEQAWSAFSTVEDAYCFSMTLDGHKMVVLTFPSGSRTWVYDIATSLWHRRVSYDLNGNDLGRWRGTCHIRAYGYDLIGDQFNGQVCFIDRSTTNECDAPQPMILTSPPTHSDRKRVFYANFEVDFETGVGLSGGVQGSDPQAMLQWSNDGSRSWSTLQPWRTIGAQGATLTRVRWAGPMGQARQRTWRLTVTDPVRRVVIAARCDTHVGM